MSISYRFVRPLTAMVEPVTGDLQISGTWTVKPHGYMTSGDHFIFWSHLNCLSAQKCWENTWWTTDNIKESQRGWELLVLCTLLWGRCCVTYFSVILCVLGNIIISQIHNWPQIQLGMTDFSLHLSANKTTGSIYFYLFSMCTIFNYVFYNYNIYNN